MKTQGLNHIQIGVSDMERSIAFYTGLLGMRVLFHAGTDLVFLQSGEGDDVFTLHRMDGNVGAQTGGLQHFGFAVRREDHAAAVAEARTYGAEVVDVGQHGDGVLYAYIKDPDGYTIELGG